MKCYYKPKDELDKWLLDNIHVVSGCCSPIEAIKYSVARETAEKLSKYIIANMENAPKQQSFADNFKVN